ncbi:MULTISPECIES: hypothetical protein [Nocardia]|uniref:Uncharacterized protein n=1 Tax=Nocardia aurea TaxID=2144174 RepID=A0ABV3G0H7_9NOCA|nr:MULTISPECIES: hypothetical protein [Nocardia]
MKARFHSDVLKQLQNLPREVFESALHAIVDDEQLATIMTVAKRSDAYR